MVELSLINNKHLCALGTLACGLIPHRGKDPVHQRASYTHTQVEVAFLLRKECEVIEYLFDVCPKEIIVQRFFIIAL
jgi:hypothetical protein